MAGITAPIAVLAATGTETFAATGGVLAPVFSLAGAGLVTFAASAAVAAPLGAIAGAADERFLGVGAIGASIAGLAGIGTTTAAGASEAPPPTATGQGSRSRVATPSFPMPEILRRWRAITGTGAVEALAGLVAGRGLVRMPPAIVGRGQVSGHPARRVLRSHGMVDNVVAQARREDAELLGELLGLEVEELEGALR
jgi:hypothetical protein